MSDDAKKEQQMLFAVGHDGESQVVILGLSNAAWEYMKEGKTHTLDLTRIGLPGKIVLFGGRDQATLKKYLNGALTSVQSAAVDLSNVDMSIKPKGSA